MYLIWNVTQAYRDYGARHMKRTGRAFAVLALSLSMMGGSAQASEPRSLGTFGAWSTFVFLENNNKVCYMAAKPQKHEGNYKSRGDIFALITHRPAEGSKNVFSYSAGYGYKLNSEAAVNISGKKFSLFTQDDMAWAPDGSQDNAITEAIKAGSSMVVKGTSARGTETTDTFSLDGSTKAYEAISTECGV